MEPETKFLYIIGTGRNGSTLLDVVLGNSSKLQSCGELYNTLAAWKNDKLCSCGEKSTNCEFWSEAKHNFDESFNEFGYENILKIKNRYERSSLAPLRIVWGTLKYSKNYTIYKRYLKTFYESLSRASGKPVIVDSSKNPFRAFVIASIFKECFYFLHLVRDGRGTMWSWMKTGYIPPWQIPIKKNPGDNVNSSDQYYWYTPWLYAFSWAIYNILSSAILLLIGTQNGMRVQYEEFIRKPVLHIKKLGNLLKTDLTDLEILFSNDDAFQVNHLIAGNRLRKSKKITVRQPDEEWKTKLFTHYKKIFWVLAGWLSKIYGYTY